MIGLNVINYGDNKNNISNQKITKIYNQGEIIISYSGNSNEIYQISMKPNQNKESFNKAHPKSKSIEVKNNSANKNIKYKTIKKQVEEMYNEIQKEIDDMDSDEESKRNIGYILRDFFTDEELSNNIKINPNPLKNMNDYLNQKHKKKFIKPYIPFLQSNIQNKNIQDKKNNEKSKIKPYINNHHDSIKTKPKEVNLQKIIDIWKDNEKIIIKINELP